MALWTPRVRNNWTPIGVTDPKELIKGRWRCLRSKLAVHVIHVPELVGACCILHNICQLHQEGFDDEWMDQDGCSCDSPAVPLPPLLMLIELG